MSSTHQFMDPDNSDRPRGAHRFDVYPPKLQRQVTLFDGDALDLWIALERSP